jgi:glycine/D-amino acid oxidase-like deaminating enzyme/nitrite reductase/ring-hydroxylating ferredoxin subunit
MKSPDGKTVSAWKKIGPPPKHPVPPNSGKADVCVVGAGIAGLSCAYMLAREGKSVIVLDDGPVGAGQTERTSAHLASAVDDRFHEVEHIHGVEGSRAAYEGNAAGIDLIERIAREEKIDCDFTRLNGYLFPAPTDDERELNRELEAAHRAGFTDARLLPRAELKGCKWETHCIMYPRQARFHPLKYLYGLASACERQGVKIYTGCRVTNVAGADPKKHTPCEAQIDGDKGKIQADAIIVATNTPAPINDWMGIYLKQASYRTYVIAMRIPRDSVADALYWDNLDAYHYVRIARGNSDDEDLLIVGGEDHKTGQVPDDFEPFSNLATFAREKFQGGPIVGQWSGQVQEPADYLAYIGRAPTAGENVFVATGDSGMGLTHGSLAAIILTDMIVGRENKWAKFYDPSRKTLDRDFISENANALAQYADWISGGEVKSPDQVPRGEGRLMREGLKKLALFRDDKGELHQCNAACTHLAGVVQWNPIEKTWDCPCHGSRFDPTGKVVMGPAIDDLKKIG